MVAEPAALPGDDRGWPDEDEHVPPKPGEPGPEETICDPGANSPGEALVDGELVAKSKDLELEGGSRLQAGAEGGKEGEEDSRHERAQTTPPRRGQARTRSPAMTTGSIFSGRTASARAIDDFTDGILDT